MEKIVVTKRNGSKEPFDLKKIARVMGAAGLTSEQTDDIVNQITHWITVSNKTEITSVEIRDQLLSLLPRVNKSSADMFAWYEKTKEA